MSADRQPVYREDIDGLRAIAVLFVVAFHAFPEDFRGGFIGVDVFFVISGFLITGIIVDALNAGEFRFVDFYARRTRRIFPALVAVLLASAIAGYLLLLPRDFAELGREILAGVLFVENWLLLGEAGYFDAASELKPLLHLWSLSIEEQFYLLWPLSLVAAFRARVPLFAVAATVFAMSFVWNLLLVQTSQPAAFYLPFTRFWELMAGAMLATAGRRAFECDARLRDALSLCGIGLIVAPAALLTGDVLFPGVWALAPVVGTSMLIASGGTTVFARYVLRHPWVVRVGLVSYPLYLWHWPILAFARNVQLKEPTALEKIGYVACAFGLALLTYRCLERPLRMSRAGVRTALALGCGLVVIGAVGWQVADHDGLPGRYPPSVQTLSRDFMAEALTAMRSGTCFVDGIALEFPTVCDGKPGEHGRKVALWGDSFAASLYPGLDIALRDLPDSQLAQFTASGCPPILGFENAHRQCSQTAEIVVRRLAALRPDSVILLARWELYDDRDGWGRIDDAALKATVARLRQIGVARIVLIGQLPIWNAPVPKIVARVALQGRSESETGSYLSAQTFEANDWAAQSAQRAGVMFVSPLDTLCDGLRCLITAPGSAGEPTSYDRGHLTVAGARYFAPAVVRAVLEP